MCKRHGKTLEISYDHKRVAGVTFPPDNQATLLSLGGIVENIAQLCECAGESIGIHFQKPEQGNPSVILDIPEETAFSSQPDDMAIFQRHTNRFAYKKDPLPENILASLPSLATGNTRISAFTDSAAKKDIWKLVRSASEIRFQTREVHEWLGKSLRFDDAEVNQGDGLDLRTLDLPPGGGLIMRFIASWKRMSILNAIGAYKLLSFIDAAPVRAAPGIVAIIGEQGSEGAMAAGRTLVKAWSELNARGIAVHPYYVVSDQLVRLENNVIPEALVDQAKHLASASDSVFSLGKGETLYMILRIGYPGKVAPRSKRLPEKTVFHDLAS
ncbi:MAG: hypothetical protein CSB48_05680 [Proteobacteria bacterium]|nr:MAG: hypothetical protein CSB48_05680 [Pseudomonadota bacterium]